MKLSFIIPIYNVEKWISHCLESCVCQDIPKYEYEIIAVNDGTTDNSMQIVDKFVNKCPNIKIINQENSGLSVARNTGIIAASGDYIWFVDSDDSLEPNVTKFLVEYAFGNKLDVLCFGVNLLYENGEKTKYEPIHKEGVFEGKDFLTNTQMPPAAWCALYKRTFLIENDLRFYPGILHEDLEFTPRAYYLAKRISYVSIIAYNYTQRMGSIMKSNDKKAKKAKDLLTVCDSLYRFTMNNIENSSPAYQVMFDKIAFAFSQSLKNYIHGVSVCEEYLQKEYYPLLISDNVRKKDRIKYNLINFSLPLYLFFKRFI